MSSKLLSVTSSPSISIVIPVGEPNTDTRCSNSNWTRKSPKNDSMSSTSAHSSSPAGASTTLLLLFMHTNLESVSEPDGLPSSLPKELACNNYRYF